MLDLNHPQTPHILHASSIEDKIRTRLVKAMRPFGRLNAQAREKLVNEEICSLRKLNANHFENDCDISASLDRLEQSILNENDIKQIWREFLNFADSPGANFGTWAI